MKESSEFPVIQNSQSLLERSKKLIPAQTQTLAKGPTQWVQGIAPAYIQRGKGSHVWDVDGNEYIDLTMAVGPLSLGYAFPVVDEAIRLQLNDGITFSMMHPLEVEVAELLRETVPNAESVRYSKTGADVTSAAIRLARAYTGRNKVLCCGYHGWHDWYIAVTDRNAGIPGVTQELSFTFNYNDLQQLIDSIDDEVAAIILEPFVFAQPNNDFLSELRHLCDAHGIVLIFDEMWTGFRIAPGGAQEYFGVDADLACFSKAVANGMPLAILTGKYEIMRLLEKDVFFFTTFGGEALSLAAAKATINYLKENKVTETLNQTGITLRDGFNSLIEKYGVSFASCTGFPCRTIINFNDTYAPALLLKSIMQQEMIRLGILWGGFHNVSYSHTESDVNAVLTAYNIVIEKMSKAITEGTIGEMLKGSMLEPVFRRTSNFNMKPKVSGTV